MPMYQYRCDDCQHEFEALYLSFSAVEKEEKNEECPKCSSKNKQRLINSNTTFILKGRGWAKDNYGGGGSSSND